MRCVLLWTVLFGLLSEGLSLQKWCGPKDTFKTPAAGTCDGYWECNRGKMTFNRCPALNTFDSYTLECVLNPLESTNVPCAGQNNAVVPNSWCSEGKTGKYPMNGLCNSYYECQNGVQTMQTCTWPTEFNPFELECKLNIWPYAFDCWVGGNVKPSPSPTPELPSTPASATTKKDDIPSTPGYSQCIKGRIYVTADPKDCSKFISCDNGVQTTKSCGYFELFDPATLNCKYSLWNSVNCSATIVSSTVMPSTTGPVTLTPSMPTSSPNTPKKLVCNKGNYYKAQYPEDCQKYFLCSNGEITVGKCSILHRFDPNTHSCIFNIPWYDNVNCYAQPEKPVCNAGDYFKVPISGSGKNYYSCSNGVLKEEECGFLQEFFPSSESCEYSILGFKLDSTDAQSDKLLNGLNCGENAFFNFTYPGDCHKYYTCFNGTFNSYECPYGQKFDKKVHKCTALTQCDLLTCHAKGPLCYPGITYLIPDSNNCQRYSECKDGQWSIKMCSWFHKFNPTTLKCELSVETIYNNVDCKAKPKCDNRSLFEEQLNKSKLERIGLKQDLEDLKSSGRPQCDKGQNYKVSFPYDCSKYYDCSDGKLTVKTCSMFNKFDPKILDCRFESPFNPIVCTTLPGRPTCEAGQNFKAVFPYDCAKFYDCSNGNLTVKECSWFQKFDPKILDCRYSMFINSVNCNSLPGEPSCSVGQRFKSVYPGQCQKYYQCKNGSVSEEQCLFWEKFDPSTLECKMSIPFFDSVNCSAVPGNGLKRTVKVRDAVSNINNNDKIVTTSKPKVVEPECTNEHNFKAVYPDNCQQYVNCNNGKETVEKCSWFKKFNPATLQCRWDLPFYRVNCSAVPGSGLPVYPKVVKDDCLPGKNFKAVDRSECDSYYSCSDGILSREHCGMMQKFNPVSLTCSVDMPLYRVNCTALPGEPDCPEKGIVQYPNPVNCRQYYECNNGSLSVRSCFFLKKFDHKSLECKWDLPMMPVDCGNDY